MAVFTTFSEAALERFLVMFDRGELQSVEPIEAGIENSNYFVRLVNGEFRAEYVLTITETLGFDEVGFFNDLLVQLARAHLPVPVPEATLDGMYTAIFCGKPTWLFPRLAGSHPSQVNTVQCQTIGDALARLHEAAGNARYTRDNPYNAGWLRATFDARRSKLGPRDQEMLAGIADEYTALADTGNLPMGTIHGDLFRDNALFHGDTLTGIIDFYHACTDYLVQDVAITLNDWCTDDTGGLDESRYKAMLEGYESVRPLTAEEHAGLPQFRRAGAMRFVLTRLLSDSGAGHLKDPEEFLRIARGLVF